ncbi:MAG: hypothetical protein ACK56I_02515 [bacterium]
MKRGAHRTGSPGGAHCHQRQLQPFICHHGWRECKCYITDSKKGGRR